MNTHTPASSPWDSFYNVPPEFILTPSHECAAEFLEDCYTIQDWGCGVKHFGGYLKDCFPHKFSYLGIDGSFSSGTDIVADLTTFKTAPPEGIFMRHVLEHNYEWKKILSNALGSFSKKFCLAIFTPFHNEETETQTLAINNEFGNVPDLSFKRGLIEKYIVSHKLEYIFSEHSSPNTQYGIEYVYKIWRSK